MTYLVAERVKETTTTTGTGTLTLAGAVSGFQSFSAIADGNTCPYTLLDANGTGWERGIGTYTASGTTLARTTVLASSNSGSAITLTSGTHTVFVDFPARDAQAWMYARQTYITGLIVTKHTAANTLDISAGSCYDPSSGKIISYAGGSAVSSGSLGASQWNQVYLYDSSGTATVEVVNNAAPPSTTYAGNARQGGTNSNRRWIGSFLTDGSSNVYGQDVKETGIGACETMWLTSSFSAPFRILSAGTATSYGSETSAVGAVPRYVASNALLTVTATYGGGTLPNPIRVDLSIDATNRQASFNMYIGATSQLNSTTLWSPLEASTPGIYYLMGTTGGTSPTAYLDINGYLWSR